MHVYLKLLTDNFPFFGEEGGGGVKTPASVNVVNAFLFVKSNEIFVQVL